MKVLLYVEKEKMVEKSGVGRARKHQMKALSTRGIEYTTNPKDDYDVAHINTIFGQSKRLFKKLKRKKVPVVYHAHTTYEDIRNSFKFSNIVARILKPRLIYLYGNAEQVITPTPYAKRLLLNYGLKNKITPISNGVDLARFDFREETGKVFRDHFGFKEDDKIVVSAGLFIERKGILDFIEVARRMPDYKFVWFGHTSKVLMKRNVIKAMKNAPSNAIFPGFITGDVFEGGFISADCFFFASNEETEGIVVLEALAAKQNIVIRDIPVFSDWLTHGENCLKGRTNNDFIRLIKEFAEGKHEGLSEEAYNVAYERRMEVIGEKLEKVYKDAIRMVK